MLDAREYLMNKADIKVSEDFLKRWLYQVNEGKFSKEDIDKDFPMFIKDFKWQTVEGRIMSDNKLEVTKDDINAEALKLARYQFAMYGLPRSISRAMPRTSWQMTSRDAVSPRRLRRM